MPSNRIFTIGYQNRTLSDVIDAVKQAGVACVVDVRALASSRRPGFSKTLLDSSLKSQDVSYLHLRELGTPPAGRLAARTGRYDELDAIYTQHLTTEEAQLGLSRLVALAHTTPVCLLCLEHEPAHCHRRHVAEAASALTGQEIHHL